MHINLRVPFLSSPWPFVLSCCHTCGDSTSDRLTHDSPQIGQSERVLGPELFVEIPQPDASLDCDTVSFLVNREYLVVVVQGKQVGCAVR